MNKVKNFTIQLKENVNGYLTVKTKEVFYGKISL